jgi:hypothetical protein
VDLSASERAFHAAARALPSSSTPKLGLSATIAGLSVLQKRLEMGPAAAAAAALPPCMGNHAGEAAAAAARAASAAAVAEEGSGSATRLTVAVQS